MLKEKALRIPKITSYPDPLRFLGDTPCFITNDHNENFYYWDALDVRNANLLRVDAHQDDAGSVAVRDGDGLCYYKRLGIAGFNCSAMHYGFFRSIQWVNPHSSVPLLRLVDDYETARTHVEEERIHWTENRADTLFRTISRSCKLYCPTNGWCLILIWTRSAATGLS